ncbi:HSP20-like chaperone [Artemisia annua]|uniref:HSP20-like chaperone n=1 Tax=Artemisia annua TaxID=35608 RepID=A0A2U1M3R6_ARTAN|nr:HSP20-like chaperone [Artemisia annua]
MANLPRISPFGDRESLNSLSVEEFVPPSAWTEDQTCHYLLVDLPESLNSLSVEEFVPPSAWTEDQTCHYLLVDLPGFKKQELKLQVDNQTHIVVSGERQVRENKFKRFEQRFELPNNVHIDKISGKLDGEILYISVPKKVEHEHQETKHDEESDNKDEKDLERNKHRMEFDEDWGKAADLYLRLAIEKLIKNKEIVMTAIFAFSLGVLVSQKFQSDGH